MEFLNHHLYRYCRRHQPPIELPRSRPTCKNDQAHVEEKNFTHVRQLIGYHQIDQPKLVLTLNALYQPWGQFLNFFCPIVKLVSKRRVGTKIIRKYYEPKTPYQLVMDSRFVSPQAKARLQSCMANLDPFDLRQTIEQRLNSVLNHLKPR